MTNKPMQETDYYENSRPEQASLMERLVLVPVLQLVPRNISPNAISLIGHAIYWASFLTCFLASELHGISRAVVLLIGALLVFSGAMADCLDGMQARRTGQVTVLGEFLDHWLDSINVPQ